MIVRPEILLFRANDAGQLSSIVIQWARQWSTLDFNGVDHWLVLIGFSSCNFRCLVPTNVAASFSVLWNVRRLWNDISSILGGPAVRTLCSCWNHGNCWSTSHIAKCTRRRFVKYGISAVVDLWEYVVTIVTWISHLVLDSVNASSIRRVSGDISFPLWIFRQTQKVATAAGSVVMWSCCESCNKILYILYFSPVKIQFNPPPIATKGFSIGSVGF